MAVKTGLRTVVRVGLKRAVLVNSIEEADQMRERVAADDIADEENLAELEEKLESLIQELGFGEVVRLPGKAPTSTPMAPSMVAFWVVIVAGLCVSIGLDDLIRPGVGYLVFGLWLLAAVAGAVLHSHGRAPWQHIADAQIQR